MGSRSQEYQWLDLAACREAAPTLFYAETDEPAKQRADREALAKAYCDICPVIEDCRKNADTPNVEPYAFRAGLSGKARQQIRRREKRKK